MNSYKYYLGLTSQLPFCSVPLRLDTYSNCQFSCSYCFAKARGGLRSSGPNKRLDPKTLEARLDRVAKGTISGATDEFLRKRVPIQMGGMTDPFSPWEERLKVSLTVLKILAKHDYPTIISTKSALVGEDAYREVLSKGNFYVRISFSAVSDGLLDSIEKGLPTVDQRLKTISRLTEVGVPVSARLQPIVPGHETAASYLLNQVADHGAVHASAEFLKYPLESSSREFNSLSKSAPDLLDLYRTLGGKRVGREISLPAEVKVKTHFQLRKLAASKGIDFGFADNEFLHLNTYASCCNAADKFLRNAHFFNANILNILKSQAGNRRIQFHYPETAWLPKLSMLSHLNSRSRVSHSSFTPSEAWKEILRRKWNSRSRRGGPADYFGIAALHERDSNGNLVFEWTGDVTSNASGFSGAQRSSFDQLAIIEG